MLGIVLGKSTQNYCRVVELGRTEIGKKKTGRMKGREGKEAKATN